MKKQHKKIEIQFVVRKYVLANSARDAIKREKKIAVCDVWVDDDWKKEHSKELAPAIGFNVPDNDDE